MNFILVFFEGLFSFFSPCVLPLIPLYIGYLSGQNHEGEKPTRQKLLILTTCFIIGIFIAIFLLNISVQFISSFFKEHMILITRIGGVLIIILGLYQFGIFHSQKLSQTKRLSIQKHSSSQVLFAFILGFTFGFAWTPCIGPALASILILGTSSGSFIISNLLVVIYALGLTLPFFIVGLFTEQALDWLSKRKRWMNIAVKAGAILLIVIGITMITGKMNDISRYMSRASAPTIGEKKSVEKEEFPLPYTLQDQHQKNISFQDLKGKVVFLNFWATWCPPCQRELPEIQKLYEKYKDSDKVAIITIVTPGNGEKTASEIYRLYKRKRL
ncbi:MAG: cytochrome c biogenesis protein/redoxin [Longibaculum sp.]